MVMLLNVKFYCDQVFVAQGRSIFLAGEIKLLWPLRSNYSISITLSLLKRLLAQLLSAHAFGAGGLGFKSPVGQIGSASPTARHRCDVSSELCSPGAKPRRWASPLVTRFGVLPRV